MILIQPCALSIVMRVIRVQPEAGGGGTLFVYLWRAISYDTPSFFLKFYFPLLMDSGAFQVEPLHDYEQ